MNNFKRKRSFNDRRKFNYTAYSPERRSGQDRREPGTDKFKLRVV